MPALRADDADYDDRSRRYAVTGQVGDDLVQQVLDRNVLARQCADLRDEIAGLRERVEKAEALAAQWRLWVDGASAQLEEAGVSGYNTMLYESESAVDNVMQRSYDDGYREAIRQLSLDMDYMLREFVDRSLGPKP
jgi:hypothetical protein